VPQSMIIDELINNKHSQPQSAFTGRHCSVIVHMHCASSRLMNIHHVSWRWNEI